MTTHLMQLAINKAWQYQLLTYPNPAVGALVTHQGNIVAIEAHQKAGTSHAEVLALTRAYEMMSGESVDFDRFDAHKAHDFLHTLPSGFFAECRIYVTLEPCSHEGRTPSCASLLGALKPKEVIIAMNDPMEGHSGGAQMLQQLGIPVTLGILQKEAEHLLEPFMIWKERAFVLFKLAQTSNGRIGGGYLSCPESLEHVHQMREVSTRLLIGGGTVRSDRPTLDSRFSGGKAPDVTIYSKNDNFDREIPLFGIENRQVTISDSLEWLNKPSFVIIEGGEGMLQALTKQIDWFLFYQTPKLSTHNLTYNIKSDLTFLHIDKKGVDLMIWSRNTHE